MFVLRICAVLMLVTCFGAVLSVVVRLDHQQTRSAMNLCDHGATRACL